MKDKVQNLGMGAECTETNVRNLQHKSRRRLCAAPAVDSPAITGMIEQEVNKKVKATPEVHAYLSSSEKFFSNFHTDSKPLFVSYIHSFVFGQIFWTID